MLQSFARTITVLLLIILIVLPVISQEATPEVDISLSPTLSPTPTASMTPSPDSSIAESTPEVTQEFSPTPSPTATLAEETAEITPEVTDESTETKPESTEAAASTEIVELTEVVVATEAVELTEEVTEASPIVGTATPGGYVLKILLGEVHYQNRAEQSGISISVFDMNGVLLSVAETNSRGVFSIAVPAEVNFVLLIEAPLHRSLQVEMSPDDAVPSFVLAGGDLNGDNCVGQNDMDLLLVDYDSSDSPESDINADGATNLSDLAILTGNYQPSCGLVAESTEAAE